MAAATGALKAADGLGSAAAAQVRDVVTGTIASVKVVLKEPFRSETPRIIGAPECTIVRLILQRPHQRHLRLRSRDGSPFCRSTRPSCWGSSGSSAC